MKFPSLSTTLKLLRPFVNADSTVHSNPDENAALTLYDKIEEIVSIATIHSNSLEIVVKFYQLSEIQQQLTVVTLVEHNMVETLEVILLSSFDVNFRLRGQTPLHFAIKDQNLNMVRVLLKHNADLECQDIYKETALNCAVRAGNIAIIKFLLEQGAEVNTKASDSTTPLEFAIHKGDVESVNVLEKYDARLGDSYLVKNL